MKYTLYHVKKLAKEKEISLNQARFEILKNLKDEDDASDSLWNFNKFNLQLKLAFEENVNRRPQQGDKKRGNNMKTYYIYFSDSPYDPLKVNSPNKTEAKKAARLYIRQWELSASILRIEEVTPCP